MQKFQQNVKALSRYMNFSFTRKKIVPSTQYLISSKHKEVQVAQKKIAKFLNLFWFNH